MLVCLADGRFAAGIIERGHFRPPRRIAIASGARIRHFMVRAASSQFS
jgi:hypothetical protein